MGFSAGLPVAPLQLGVAVELASNGLNGLNRSAENR
jgi:hypothetical protein